MQGGGREAKQRRKRGGSGGGSGCPGPRLHPPPEQTSSRSHRNGSGLPGAWAAPARRVRIFEGVRCVKGKNAARLSTGKGSGGWARAWGRGLSVCAPLAGLSHRPPGALACLACSHQSRPSHRRGSGSQSSPQGSGEAWPGSPSPVSLSRALIPGPRGRREEDLDGVQILHFLLELPGKTLEATEGRPAGRGADGRRTDTWRGGEAPLAVRIRHRDRRTRGTILSLQGPHGGDTANTLLNNPGSQAEGHGAQRQATHTCHEHMLPGWGQGAGVHWSSLVSSSAGGRTAEV